MSGTITITLRLEVTRRLAATIAGAEMLAWMDSRRVAGVKGWRRPLRLPNGTARTFVRNALTARGTLGAEDGAKAAGAATLAKFGPAISRDPAVDACEAANAGIAGAFKWRTIFTGARSEAGAVVQVKHQVTCNDAVAIQVAYVLETMQDRRTRGYQNWYQGFKYTKRSIRERVRRQYAKYGADAPARARRRIEALAAREPQLAPWVEHVEQMAGYDVRGAFSYPDSWRPAGR